MTVPPRTFRSPEPGASARLVIHVLKVHEIPGWMTRLQVSTQPAEKFTQFTRVALYARISRKARLYFYFIWNFFPTRHSSLSFNAGALASRTLGRTS